MRRFLAVALISCAFAFGCASVLGLDSGTPLDLVADGGPPDAPAVDTAAADTVTGADGAVVCSDPQKDCGGVCRDQNDPRYGCGPTACSACSGANVDAFGCEVGKCKIARCAAGFDDCDKDPSNGCEADLGLPMHCGSCTTDCTAMGKVCSSQHQCASGCSGTETNCSGACVNLDNNTEHCGKCDVQCPRLNAVPTCMNQQCSFTCMPGYVHCNPSVTTGCEQNEDNTHCGPGCKDCTGAFSGIHEQGVCNAGLCAPNGCEANWYDCDNDPLNANGCESNAPCATDAGSDAVLCRGYNATCNSSNPDCCPPMTCQPDIMLPMTPLPAPPTPDVTNGHCCVPAGAQVPSCAVNMCCGTPCTDVGGPHCP
jgi:hypothetical protein